MRTFWVREGKKNLARASMCYTLTLIALSSLNPSHAGEKAV